MAENLKHGLCVEWKTDVPYEDTPRQSPGISFQDSVWFLNLELTDSIFDGYFRLSLFKKDNKAFTSFQETYFKTQDTLCTAVSDDLQSLSRDFTTFLEDETFSDVKMTCGDRTFSAHRSVLAARSEVFGAMFRNKMAEADTGMVDIQDMDPEILELLLQYAYSGKRPDLTEDNARRLYEAADKYAIHALKKACSDWMVEHLSFGKSLDLLVLADEHSDEKLKEMIARFVTENLQKRQNRESWCTFKEVHSQLAIKVFEMCFANAMSD